MKGRFRTGFFAAVAMIIVILDTKTAITGAKEGLTLCITTVIPSLLPFFVLTILVTSTLVGIKTAALKPLERICKMSEGTGILMLTGLIGGYPTGAQCVADTYRRGAISRDNAIRLLSFCSNAGPSYIFGILAVHFSSPAAPWLLWGIHILSCIIVAMALPGDFGTEEVTLSTQNVSFISAVERAGKNIAKVCVWIILFRVVIAFLERWILWYADPNTSVLFCGILELTIGGTELGCISTEGLRFIVCSIMLGFGGICVVLQTGSVIGDLPVTAYIKGKIMQAFISLFLSFGVQFCLMTGTDRIEFSPIHTGIMALFFVLFFIFTVKIKNKCSIMRITGV